ncbi:MAG: bifunctional adenosylcobinamide kinase/adenosylcobinamide-phosphate guanylyltransferase [Nitrospira bacterium HGW-Nitrospira-1]|nr:MAG: bifunctional adenosylcobinamide kinase/adenosylcobinamide-phosphate guanylyltransferase [Nitrospira bacterium HGW-Nitrospira-1]
MKAEKGKIVFILGGAKSGKSSFALKKASLLSGKKAYIATAQALDDEMAERIEKHKSVRGSNWDTFEEPTKISEVIEKIGNNYSVITLDCLTLWLSNMMCGSLNASEEIERFFDSLRITHHASRLFIVSNEVGMGIVPENELSRRFRDLSGYLNQRVAQIADEVYLVTAGIPIKIK